MKRTILSRPLLALAGAVLLGASLLGPLSGALVHADGDTVSEIHYSFGSAPEGTLTDSVVFDWLGQEQTIYYGPDATYGQTAVAQASPRYPGMPAQDTVDLSLGPIQEVTLSGLAPSTTYHYRIGATGLDHTFQTIPAGDFSWVDVGDTVSSSCDPWMQQTHQTIADLAPAFVTHGGDITYANECGEAAVHQYFVDQQLWSDGAAFQPAIGNHEYANPNSDEGMTPPPGTPRDSMSNYKDRIAMTNPQIVPTDQKSNQINNPGCGWEIGSATNTCPGDDWGWFETGHVLYISYPEPWVNAQTAWEPVAANLMAQAQNDPNIDFIITYGHRPGISSNPADIDSTMTTALNQLATTYSPASGNTYGLNGKYIMNVAHHVHNREVFQPINGLVNIVDGGGGAGQVAFKTPMNPNSIWGSTHPGVLQGIYSASQHSLTINMVCGAVYNNSTTDPCTRDAVQYTQTFTRPSSTPPAAVISTTLTDNNASPQVGQQITYTAGVSNQTANSTASGVTTSVTLPVQETIVNANGGTINGQTVSWNIGYVTGGQPPVAEQVVAQVASGNAGDTLTATAAVTTSDTSCQNAGSICAASDTDTIAATPPPSACTAPPAGWTENSGNLSLETNLSGWNAYNTSTALTRFSVPGGSFDGLWALKIAPTSGAIAGVNNGNGLGTKPVWVSSTTAGKTYTASAVLKASTSGEQAILVIQEFTGSSQVGTSTSTKLTLGDTTAWHSIANSYVAKNSGDLLKYNLYDNTFTSTSQYFLADCLSLQSSN